MARWDETDLESRRIRVATLVALNFPSGIVRLHTGIGELLYDDDVYQGIGLIGEIADIEESPSVIPPELEMGLSGTSPEILRIAIRERYRTGEATVYFGVLDRNNVWLPGWPKRLFEGRMSHMYSPDSAATELRLISRHRLDTPVTPRRYTDEDHRDQYPGDEFFSRVPAIQGKVVYLSLIHISEPTRPY